MDGVKREAVKGLILFDWDNTIVDADYAFNDKASLMQAIRLKIGQGWHIGLNSDTPLERLKGWWRELGMHGPIVAERGAVAWWPTPQEYKVPQGGFYRWVSSPNYFGEIVQWIGWAIATWSLAGLSFAVWTVANLAPRARANHRWYQENLPGYPPERKALIPGVW